MLFVEGARDREILSSWARRTAPVLVRCIEQNSVIMGGRRPARALSEFQKRGGAQAGLRGLIVLDRDDLDLEGTAGSDHGALEEAGLEVFVWSLRHVESYLLVPAAIRRVLRLDADDPIVERALSILISAEETAKGASRGRSTSSVHAKRMLGAGGSLSEVLGVDLHAGEIARAMSADDLHPDVRALFDRIGTLSGLIEAGPEVVIRK